MLSENLRKYLTLFLIILALLFVSIKTGLNTKQMTSVVIIGLFIGSTFLFWDRRLTFAFIGVSALLVVGVLDIAHLVEYANLNIILFLVGMMIIIGYLEKNNFFEMIIGRFIEFISKRMKKSKYYGVVLISAILFMSAISAALIDEVTSILIMVAIVLHLVSKYKLNPVPFILMTVFATNIGSSATAVGNPVGVMIALNAGLSFSDFLRWATPISMVCLFLGILISIVMFRKDIKEFDKKIRKEKFSHDESISSSGKNIFPAIIALGVLVFLIFHKQIENLLGLEKNAMLIGTALIGAGFSMLLEGSEASELVEKRVDWWTLLFFMFLFASVGSLKYTGVIDILSKIIAGFTGGEVILTIVIIMLVAGLLSAMLDNVLAVAVMVPIVQNIISSLGTQTTGMPYWWALLFAATLFGNMTHIGSTANIVALGMMNKRKLGHIGLKKWIVPGIIITVITASTAFVLILIQLPLMK